MARIEGSGKGLPKEIAPIEGSTLESAILYWFLDLAQEDTRLGSAHISLYNALWKKWKDKGCEQPLSFCRAELVAVSKLSGYNSYHKTIRQLHEYGYIRYLPSYHPYQGSKMFFTALWDIPKTSLLESGLGWDKKKGISQGRNNAIKKGTVVKRGLSDLGTD